MEQKSFKALIFGKIALKGPILLLVESKSYTIDLLQRANKAIQVYIKKVSTISCLMLNFETQGGKDWMHSGDKKVWFYSRNMQENRRQGPPVLWPGKSRWQS